MPRSGRLNWGRRRMEEERGVQASRSYVSKSPPTRNEWSVNSRSSRRKTALFTFWARDAQKVAEPTACTVIVYDATGKPVATMDPVTRERKPL